MKYSLIIFVLFSVLFYCKALLADDYPTPRFVTNKNEINCRSGYMVDDQGTPLGSIKYTYLKKYYPFEVTRNINDQWVEAKDPLSNEVCFLYRPILSGVRGAITSEEVLAYNNPREKKVIAKLAKYVHGIIKKADSVYALFEVKVDDEGKTRKFYVPKDKLIGIYQHEMF